MRDFILRLCLRAYPSTYRQRDGRAILDLARDLSSQGGLAFPREAVGMLAGGFRAHGTLLRLDLTSAPWRAARERLALPLAVGMLCVIVAFLFAVQGLDLRRMLGWWALLVLIAAVGAVVGAAFGRRYLAITASFVILILVVVDVRSLLTNNQREPWFVSIGPGGSVGNVVELYMWLPLALLLLICAGAVGSAGRARGSNLLWIICLPVVVSALVAARWQGLLGALLIDAPLALVAATAIWGAMRKNPVARAAASLLVGASCFLVQWLLLFVIPYPPALEPYFPLVHFGGGALVACVIIRFLLRDRVRIPA